MEDWIYTTDINGNKGWLNTKTNLFRTTYPSLGTILLNTEKSVGFRPHVKLDRIKAAVKVKNSYNSRLYTPHNHSDETIKLKLNHQEVTVDRNGNPHIILKSFTPKDEAPMKIEGPENLVVETAAVPIAPIKFGVAELAGRFGNGLLLNWGRKTVLEDAFKSAVDKGLTDTAESLVAKQAAKEIAPKYNEVRYISINTPKSVKEIVNNFDSKVTNLRNLKNQSLGKSNTRVFNHNNINYTVDNEVDDITMSNYLENANGVGKHIEWYPKNWEKYVLMIRDNGFRFLDLQAYDDGVKLLAKDLASNDKLLYSKDFLSKVEAAAKNEGMNSFDLLKDILTASRMLNFKPLPARPKYEIPVEDLASENFSTLNKNVSGVYYPGKHTIYMEFNANGEPTTNNALYTWIHENEHYFLELFKDEFNSKSNRTFMDRGYITPDSNGLKFMSLIDGSNHPEAALSLAEKGSTNKEHLLPYYEFFIKLNKDFDYNDVNNLIDQMGGTLERLRLSSTEYSPNAYDEVYVKTPNNQSNYILGIEDLITKYKQEFGKEPYANELLDYGNKNKEFLHKYLLKVPTLPEEIDDKRVWGRMDALKFGLGLIPTAGILLNKHKDGGKMKISFGKSGIHIKKLNEGKFTEYCGGKVTQDCINKAKASGNSKLVKRAVFAENARHWKHLNGGILKKWGQSLKDTYLNIPIELVKAAYNTITHGDPNYDYKGRFNGGSFNGAGAGGSWTTTKLKLPSNFNEAFDLAVKNKLKTFTFNGLLYNTNHENNPVRETNNRIIGEIRSKSKKKDTNYTHMAGPIHVGNLDAIPMVTNKNGGILKGSMGMEAPIDPPDNSFVLLALKSGSGVLAAPRLRKIYYDAKSNGATEQQAAAATITAAFESHGNYLAKNGKYKGLGLWDTVHYPGGYLNQIKALTAKNKSLWSKNGYSQFINPSSSPADTTRVYTRDFIRGGNPATRAKIATLLFGMTENK